MVAGGPYGLEEVIGKTGYAAALWILILTPLLWSLPTALMVSELASAIPEEGGFYIWVRRGMGRFWGYQETWLTLTGSVFEMALYPTLFVDYLGHFAPSMTAGSRGIFLELAMIATCAAWNIVGARAVGGGSVWLNALLFLPFLALVAIAAVHPAGPAQAAVPAEHVDLFGGILIAMWNYMGWDNLSTIAGEVERPQRTYPLAMLGAVILVVVSYVVPVAAVAKARVDLSVWTAGGWVDAGRALGGNWLALAVAGSGRDRRHRNVCRADAVVHAAARRDGDRRLSAADLHASRQQDGRALGVHTCVRRSVGGLPAAGICTAADSRRAADRLEHPAGVCGAGGPAHPRAQS